MIKPGSWTRRAISVGLAACAVLFTSAYPQGGEAGNPLATAPSLGTAQSFAVLGGSTVTNTGPSAIVGDLGVAPGSAVTGFPPGTVAGGSIHAADAVATQAQTDVTTAYNALAGQACNTTLTGQDLGGLTLTPNVYCFSSSAQLTGVLTLDAQGNANAVFVFQIGSTLTTASASTVRVINSGQACNVFWQVGSSATLGTTTVFVGNILALTSITLNTGAGASGRALARNGAVTLDSNNVTAAACGPVPTNTPVPVPTNTPGPPPTNTPVPGTPGQPTNTPGPIAATNTPVPSPTNTPIPAPTSPPPPPAIPEADMIVLFGTGLVGLGGYAALRARSLRRKLPF